MSSEREQKDNVFPFLNPMDLWQNYLTSWIEKSRAYYENTIKFNEYWLKTFWYPWLRVTDVERKETAKVE
jgi:hypothetical protein